MAARYSVILGFVFLTVFANASTGDIINGTNQGFGGPVAFKLGGTDPGFGADNHDQINDSATILLAPTASLSILPSSNNFVPSLNDSFEIMTWQTGLHDLNGNPTTFQSVTIDPFFTNNAITFNTVYTNTAGAGNLTLVATAVPEPSAFFFGGVLCIGFIGRCYWKRFAARMLR